MNRGLAAGGRWLAVGGALIATGALAQTPPPLTLREAVSRAVASSPELRGMRAAVAEASANAILAEQAFRPSASISTTPGYASGLPTTVLGQVPAIGTVEAHQVFYDLSEKANVLASRSEVEAANAELDARTRETARSVSETYARYAVDQVLLDAARRRAVAYDVVSTRIEALLAEGRVRQIDAARAALQRSTAQRAVQQAQTALELDELRLRRAVGWPAGQPLVIQPEPIGAAPSIPADDLAMAEGNDPALRSLKARVEQLQKATALQRNLFRPTVGAQIQYSRLFDRYGRFYLNFKPDDFSVAATIQLPLFTGGRRAAVVSRLAAQLERASAQVQQRKDEIEIQTREAEAGLKDAIAENDLAHRAHELASESLRVSQAMQKEGRGDANDVPIAEAALAEADQQSAEAALHLRVARARLAVLRGELPESR